MPHVSMADQYTITSTGDSGIRYSDYKAPIEWYWAGGCASCPVGVESFDLKEQKEGSMRRIVLVTVVDPDPKVPADHSLLYMSPGWFVTDCNNDELKMSLDIRALLDRHNAYREQVVDREASKGRAQSVYLEPAKFRDLQISVHELGAR